METSAEHPRSELVPTDGTEVGMPPTKTLILRGRAALADLGYDPDDRVDEQTDAELRAAVPAGTVKALYWGWGRFIHWCGVRGRRHDPPTAATVRQYIKDHWDMTRATADGRRVKRGRREQPYAPATVELAVYVISMVCNRLEWANPIRHPDVHRQLEAYALKYERAGFRSDEADPISLEQNAIVVRSCDLGTVNGLRNAAMFRLQFDMGCRAAELCAVQMGDVQWVSEHRVLITFIASQTKTRQERTVAVEAAPDNDWDVDPVRLLTLWWDAKTSVGHTAGPLFTEVSPGMRRKDWEESRILGGRILTTQISLGAYEEAWNRAVKKTGIDLDPKTKRRTKRYTTHANRAGFITEAADEGVPLERVALRTGHSPASPVLHRYYRSGRRWGDYNAGAVVRRSRKRNVGEDKPAS